MDSTGRITLEILDRIRSGVPSGLEDFVHRLGPRILVFINYRLGDKLRGKVEPEDVLQDFFASLVENRAGFLDKVENRGVHRTIYRLVENHIKDLYERHFQTQKRDSHREVRASQTDSSRGGFSFSQVAGSTASFSKQIEAHDEYQSLQRILDRLDDESKRLFVLKFIEVCTNQEIAEELGVSVSTVKRQTSDLMLRIQRARKER
jgi:RNA polymerase sigma-70 factor (ECF subfamily)